MTLTLKDCRSAEEQAVAELKIQFGNINSPKLAQAVAETRAYYFGISSNL